MRRSAREVGGFSGAGIILFLRNDGADVIRSTSLASFPFDLAAFPQASLWLMFTTLGPNQSPEDSCCSRRGPDCVRDAGTLLPPDAAPCIMTLVRRAS